MYFVFTITESDDIEVAVTVGILELQSTMLIERTTELGLIGIFENLSNAQALQQKVKKHAGAAADLLIGEAVSAPQEQAPESDDLASKNQIYALHLVWLRQRALTIHSSIDDDGYDIGIAHGSLKLSLESGDEFAMALATEIEEEAKALGQNRELAIECVYYVTEEEEDDEDDAPPTPHGMTWKSEGDA